MITLHSSMTTTVERPTDRRLRVPWGKKAIPLKNSMLFDKAKHSEEWHQSIGATAGVLHPSDQKFPYGFLRNHTEAYLKKKGKINQADIDIKLAILITSYDARDIAVAAAAHAMTAKSLRALLHSDLNIMQGSYCGLKTWLQCLIAANDGNAASVTDLEALFARKLLPFASQGSRAAEWYLVGVCRTLREMAIPNMEVIPEFAMVMKRAIVDYAIHLEGLRLRNDWAAAYEAVLWIIELAKTSHMMAPSGYLLPEHILDSQFPAWKIWNRWKPDMDRIKVLARADRDKLAVVSDLVALEGPDLITGKARTLRDGLIMRYDGAKGLLRWRSIIIEVPSRTREALGGILTQVAQLLEIATSGSGPGHVSKFELFRYFTITQPITTENLKSFEATCRIPFSPENDIYNAVREVLDNQDRLGGGNILATQNLLRIFADDCASSLREVFLQEWFRLGIETCVKECQDVVRAHIDQGLAWTQMAIDYHTFCTAVKASERHWPKKYQTMKIHPPWLSSEDLNIVMEIHDAFQAQQQDSAFKATTLGKDAHEITKPTGKVPIPLNLLGEEESGTHSLLKLIEAYCMDRVLGQPAMSESSEHTIEAMMYVWKNTSNLHTGPQRRNLALLVAKSGGHDFKLSCRCLTSIAFMSLPGTSVINVINIIQKSESELSEAIVDFTNLLVAPGEEWAECWKELLFSWIERQAQPGVFKEGYDLLQYSLRTMDVTKWLSFMRHLALLLSDCSPNHTIETMSPILHPKLMRWTTTLTDYIIPLTRLETVVGKAHESIRGLLTCYTWATSFTTNLQHLYKAQDKPAELLLQRIVGKLGTKAYKEPEIQECLVNLAIATPEAVEICYRVWDAKHEGLEIPGLPNAASTTQSQVPQKQVISRKALCKSAVTGTQSPLTMETSAATKPVSRRAVPSSVVQIMVAGWICSDNINETDKTAIASVAGLLEIHVEPLSGGAWNSKLTEAMQFWEAIESEILTEATRLESLTKSLKARAPIGTTILLQELGIPSNSLLDDEMETLPPGLIDVVERMGENEFEISFPLNAFTDLQQGSMGIPEGATSFLLRLCLPTIDGMPYTFCIHFNNDKDIDTIDHKHFEYLPDLKSPPESICKTTQTAFTWQLRRVIHAQIRAGQVNIVDIHKFVKMKIECLGQSCVSCDTLHLTARKAQIRRSVPCNLLACARLWYDLPLDVRIPEIRTDIYVVDLMLMSVHAAAMSGRTELLPACPIRSTETIKTILDSLPSLTLISHAVNISAVLESYHNDAETLISWACVHHRGYIATATGLCKVPTMPYGTHQFVLANASPKIESNFLTRLAKPSTRTSVLFHGTKFDRLPAILAQGLRVCSGTSLQRTGAAHGKGIYLAEEPVKSLTYSSPTTSWRNSGLANMRLLLGCEVIVGAGKSVPSGIHVVMDELSVMVRYIFLFTGGVNAPIANHMVPAMASGMSALRTGAV